MKTQMNMVERRQHCEGLERDVLADRALVIVANRGPVSFQSVEEGNLEYQRGSGGLVTALIGLAQHVEATWIATASTEADIAWGEGVVSLNEENQSIRIKFIVPDQEAYDGYYNVIANPLIWFLQHNMWDLAKNPQINRKTWQAWEQGYVKVNKMFAEAIAGQIRQNTRPTLVMLQDYHLYLAPRFIRQALGHNENYTLLHFIHIPWPGGEDWEILPPGMRGSILDGLCAVDLLGFQTHEDGLNFIRTCESLLPRSHVNFRHGRIWYRNHATHVRDFPISIDVEALSNLAQSQEVRQYHSLFEELAPGCKLVVRIDRTEPSKNIVRGFHAFDEMLDLHPEHVGKVVFLAIMAPSRLKVEEYQNYLDELMAAAGRVNAKHGDSNYEPVRVLVGENYPRAVAALQLYDVLLVNSIADGMNLVAKEGPIVNLQNGVVLLSERTGARQQLEAGALVISPCDIYATAEALHQALIMPEEERKERADRLRWVIEREDISDWLCRQLESIQELNL